MSIYFGGSKRKHAQRQSEISARLDQASEKSESAYREADRLTEAARWTMPEHKPEAVEKAREARRKAAAIDLHEGLLQEQEAEEEGMRPGMQSGFKPSRVSAFTGKTRVLPEYPYLSAYGRFPQLGKKHQASLG